MSESACDLTLTISLLDDNTGVKTTVTDQNGTTLTTDEKHYWEVEDVTYNVTNKTPDFGDGGVKTAQITVDEADLDTLTVFIQPFFSGGRLGALVYSGEHFENPLAAVDDPIDEFGVEIVD